MLIQKTNIIKKYQMSVSLKMILQVTAKSFKYVRNSLYKKTK